MLASRPMINDAEGSDYVSNDHAEPKRTMIKSMQTVTRCAEGNDHAAACRTR